jgi:hypothetical protein
LTYLGTHTIGYGPTIVGDNQYHSLTNGGGFALERAGQCAATTNVVADLNTYDTTHASRRWKLDPNPDGTARTYDSYPTLTITNPATGYVLDSAAVNAGAAVVGNPASTANSQDWGVR